MAPKSVDNEILRNYLESQLVYLSYLQPNGVLRSTKKYLIYILLVSQLYITIRFSIILCLDPSDPILNYIVDQNAHLGRARNYFHTVGLTWIVASNYAGWMVKQSEVDPSRQRWTGISQALKSYRFHGYGGFRRPVKFGLIFGRIFHLSGSITSFLYVVPFFFWAEHRYWGFGLAMAFHQALCGSMVVSWNMVTLYCLHMYLFARVYKLRVKDLTIISDENFDLHFLKWISTIQELRDVYNFYKPSNESAFCSTFVAQILIVYFVFFAETSESFKAVFGIYFVLNYVAGQSIHFFFSAYTQNKVKTSN